MAHDRVSSSGLAAGAFALLALALAGCSDADVHRADRAVDKASADTKRAVHRAAPDVENAAAKAVGGIDKLAAKAGRAADHAGDDLKRAGRKIDHSVDTDSRR